MTEGPPPSRWELLFVVGLGVGHVATELLVSPAAATIYNVSVSVLVLAYLVWRAATVKGMLRAWGMRLDNLRPALRVQARFAVPTAAALVVFGLLVGTMPLPRTFWTILFLYPVWGIAQQFALQNLIGRNLAALVQARAPHALATSLLFSAAHFPNYRLMLLTLGAGFFFTFIYRTRPNLWAVGVLHGFLGALTYYLVLGQDPGAELLRCLGWG